MAVDQSQQDFNSFFAGVSSSRIEDLRALRTLYPERVLCERSTEWRYRVLGSAPQTLLLLPGGELVNDLVFQFALDMQRSSCRVLYPAYPRVSSLEELADGLVAILDAEKIESTAILGASFGGAVTQVLVRRHPHRINAMILSNTGVPMRRQAPAVWALLQVANLMSWPVLGKLLTNPMIKILDPAYSDYAFWRAYLQELFVVRLTKPDVLANIRQQLEYHWGFRFTPNDLPGWKGRVLIAESDTDVIGPRRRQALREAYPHAELHTFHNAGHAPIFTRYDEYLAMVKAFLGCTSGPSALSD